MAPEAAIRSYRMRARCSIIPGCKKSGGAHETPRFSDGSRRRGGVSAPGQRAAEGDAVIGKAEQGSRVPVVGVLLNEPPEPAFAAFHEKFRELGYEEAATFGSRSAQPT